MMRLSVREEQLTRAIERELPALAERVPADYFLLLVVQGHCSTTKCASGVVSVYNVSVSLRRLMESGG